MTLRDLFELCRAYVPRASRHPHSRPLRVDDWWAAHEIGHMLTVDPVHVGDPMFAIHDPDGTAFEDEEHKIRCLELAAMSVSRRLLRAAGRRSLIRNERKNTDTLTLFWNDRGRVRKILAARGCLRIPRTRRELERRLADVRREAAKARRRKKRNTRSHR